MEIVGFLGQGEGGSVGEEGQQLLEKIVRWRWLIGVLHGFSLLSTAERRVKYPPTSVRVSTSHSEIQASLIV